MTYEEWAKHLEEQIAELKDSAEGYEKGIYAMFVRQNGRMIDVSAGRAETARKQIEGLQAIIDRARAK